VKRWLPVFLVPVITAAIALVLVADGQRASESAVAETTCPVSLQTLIDATPSGATLDVPGCVYRETVTVSRPMTINGAGAVIDGRDTSGRVVRAQWMRITASDVTVRGITMRYANDDYSIAGLETAQTGVERFRLEDCDVSGAFININLTGTTDSEVRNCAIHDARHLGIRVAAAAVGGGLRNRIVGNRIYHNDRVGEPDPNVDAGGLKATNQVEVVIEGNVVHDNGGAGLWLDAACLDATVRDNEVHHNEGAGIMDETSTGTTIAGNAAWANGFGPGGTWGWGAGILVSSSKGVDVYDNVVAWNNVGISVISQDRPDSPGATDTTVHDNVIVEEQPSATRDHFGLFWGQDWAGPMYLDASGNRGSDNRYHYPGPEDRYWRFVWDGGRSTLTDFNSTPGEQDGRYLSWSETAAILEAAGVPTAR